jgi:hypothetical protein
VLQELTSECVIKTPIRSLAHKHGSFKHTQDRQVHRRAWKWCPTYSVVRPKNRVSLSYLDGFRVRARTFICLHETWKRLWVIRDTILLPHGDMWEQKSMNSYELAWAHKKRSEISGAKRFFGLVVWPVRRAFHGCPRT